MSLDPPLDRQRARVPRRQPRRASGPMRLPGGGDTDIAVDDQGNHYFVDLEALVNLGTSVSNDNGNNWRKNPRRGAERSSRPAVVHRRQRDDRERRGQHRLPRVPRERGRHVHLLEPGLDRPDRPGRRPRLAERLRRGAEAARGRRHLRADPLRQGEAQPLLRLQRGHARPRDDRPRRARPAHGDPVPQRDACRTRPAAAARGTSSPALATDSAGTVYTAWIDTNDNNVYYSYSTDQGTSWTTPAKVNTAPSNTAEFLWAQAGSPGHACARLVRDRHARPARLVPELGRRPAGRHRGQVVGLRGPDHERRLARADGRPAALHREADALRPDLQPGHRLHGLRRRPDDGRLLRGQLRQERRAADRLQRHDEPEPRRAPVRGAPAPGQDLQRQVGQRGRAEEPDEGRRRRRAVAALLAHRRRPEPAAARPDERGAEQAEPEHAAGEDDGRQPGRACSRRPARRARSG